MKKYFLFALLFHIQTIGFSQFISAEHMGFYTVDDIVTIAQDLGVPVAFITPEYDVDVYKITYNTPHPNGGMTLATGAFCIPQAGCDFPIASYQHGTTALKTGVPSYYSGELNVGILLATTGYHMCMPDYIGLGDSPGYHPYVHAKSEATASVDMIKASKTYATQEGIPFNEQLLILGYSQGGHSTMALHKEIQENDTGLTVTASFPLSGPYDVSGIQTEFIVSDEPYATPGYLPYILFAYNAVYGTLFNEPSDIFVAPFDVILPPLFDGTHGMGEINSLCTPVPKLMLKSEVVDSFMTDPDHRFRVALRDNDLYDWTPQAPVHIYYCEGDDQVNYMNSIVALDAFTTNGATDVQATNLGDGDHGECYAPAILATKFKMDEYKAACTTSTKTVSDELPIQVYPNPATDMVTIEIPNTDGLEKIIVYNSKGQVVYQFTDLNAGQYSFDKSTFGAGMYFIQGIGERRFGMKLVIL